MTLIGKLFTVAVFAASTLCSSLAFAQNQQQRQAFITLPPSENNATSGRLVGLQFPLGTRPDTVTVVLNGKNISDRFQRLACTSGVCLSATLTGLEGLRDGHNALYATAINEDGRASSSRRHFDGSPADPHSVGHNALRVPRAANVDSTVPGLPTMSSFLPPTVALNTLAVGGAPANSGWLRVGSQETLSTGNCGSEIYSVIVLDRQTLEEKVAPPESSPQCFSSGAALSAYLVALNQTSLKLNDIVVVGTNYNQNSDAGSAVAALQTNLIGGRTYNCPSSCMYTNSTADVPIQYLAIGALGAEPGSAYENYTTSTNQSADSYATGMFVEDASGNYNYQSSGNVEYVVQPAQTAAQAYIQLNNPPSFNYQLNSSSSNVMFWPPSISNNAAGFWLLILDRNNLSTVPGCQANAPSNGQIIIPNCGQFFATAGSQGSPANIAKIAPALNNVTSTQIAILTTVGTAGWGTPEVMAGTPSGGDNGMIELAGQLQRFGIPDKLILQTGTPGSTYTIVGAPGLGGPLNGHNVLSTSYLSQQGQTGYIHGTFAKDSNGLFEPAHTQQEPGLDSSSGVATDDANLQLGVVLSQQPVEWPIFAAPLNGSVTLAGQIDAYKYLSWNLLNNHYFIGQFTQDGLQYAVAPPYAYDIHYFFTGSLNTWIDIHTYDPMNVQFPPSSNGCGSCTWQGPDGTQLNFTVAEFAAAQAQLHNEIADLTNVLTYFVTGSTNLKDVVAAGNSNTALSLLQAFSTVEANINQQGVALAQSTPVKVSPWHIVNMIAGAVAPAVTFVTAGEVNTADIKLADKAIGIIGDLVTAAGSTNGGLSSGHQSSTNDIPRLDYSLDTTVGQLAGIALQSQFLAGFDATLDSITGDWYKLNALGSSAVANQVLFSPSQGTQNTSINAITTAEQRSLFMSLIPSAFQVGFWNMTSHASSVPDMGYTSNGNINSCSTFYPGITTPPANTAAPNVFVAYPSYGGLSFQQYWYGGTTGYPFQFSEAKPYQDWYVLSLPFINQGHSNTNAQVMNNALANILFGSGAGQANLSLDEFVAQTGPMNFPLTGGGSQWIDFDRVQTPNPPFSSYTNAIGLSPANICSQSEVNNSALGTGNPTPPAGTTTTTLQVAPSAVLGASVTLQAKVVVQATAAPAGGSVQFRDGLTVLQTVTLDGTGSATYSTDTLALGTHSLSASFASTDGSTPSDSIPQVLTVYASSPDLQLSLSRTSLNVSYGVASPATTLQVQAVAGMSGTVNYACTGLPVGMTCNFTPSSGNLTSGATVTTSFTITGTAPATSSIAPVRGWGTLLLTIPALLMGNIRRSRGTLPRIVLPLLLLMVMVGGSIGCGDSSPKALKDTGSKTILISATSGTLTKSTPLIVNVQ